MAHTAKREVTAQELSVLDAALEFAKAAVDGTPEEREDKLRELRVAAVHLYGHEERSAIRTPLTPQAS